ncbi:MAG: hypothetical protein V2A53_03110, partial [bacterium]
MKEHNKGVKLKGLKWGLVFLMAVGFGLGLASKSWAIGTVTLRIKPNRVMELDWATSTGTYKVYRNASSGSPAWFLRDSNATPPWKDTSLSANDNYQYKVEEVGVGYSTNEPIGYADGEAAIAINDLSVAPMPQSRYATITWTTPYGGSQIDKNGGQYRFKVYRKKDKEKFTNVFISDSNLIAVATTTNSYDSGDSFECVDGTTTASKSIRNPSWSNYEWADNNLLAPATQYAYAVKTVDPAYVWTLAGSWAIDKSAYHPIGTGSNASGNQASIDESIPSNQVMLITSINNLSASAVINQGINLTWSASTETFGAGYYFKIYRATMTVTGEGTLTQGSLTSAYYIGDTSILNFLDTTGVQGSYKYSYAVVVYDLTTLVTSPLSNDCTILADWTAPVIQITNPATITYSYGTRTTNPFIVQFSYTEPNANWGTATIYGPGTETTIIGSYTFSPGSLTLPYAEGVAATITFINAHDGTYTVKVEILDKSSNVGSDTKIGYLWIDSTPPATATILEPGSNTVVKGTITFGGQFMDNETGVDTATCYWNGYLDSWGTDTAPGETHSEFGSWNTILSGDGIYDLYGVVIDKAGNQATSTIPYPVTVDNTAPDIFNTYPTSSNIAYKQGTDSLVVLFTYTEMTPRTCTVSILTIAFSTTTTQPSIFLPSGINSSGSATLIFDTLPDGTYTVQVVMEDGANSFGTCTSPNSLIIDTTAPDITNTYPLAGDIAYRKASDQIIVQFTYTETYPQTTTVTLWDSSGNPLVSTTTTSPNNTITGGTNLDGSATLIFSGVSDGVCTVTVSILDKSGNLNTCTSASSVIIDSTKATVTVISALPTYTKLNSTVEVVFTYDELNPNTATVTIGTDGTTYGSTTVNISGSGTTNYVTTTITLSTAGSDGTLAVTVYVGDKVGNVGSDTKDLILFDNHAPDIFNIYPTSGNIAYRQGTDTLIVQFTYTEMTPKTCTVSMVGTAFSTTTTLPSTFLPLGTNRSGSATLNFTGLTDGTYTVRVVMEDGANSFGTCTSPNSLIIDNILPILEVYSGSSAILYRCGTDNLTIYYTYTELYPATLTLTIASGTTQATETTITGLTGGSGQVTV